VIFVTAGTQEPFDRLLQVIDVIAADLKDTTFIVQALQAKYVPKNIKVLHLIPHAEFKQHMDDAKLIISHAGMGTIITALEKRKPIIVIPRLLKYHEHRNEHQLATAKKMDELGYVDVAYDEDELIAKVKDMWPDKLQSRNAIGNIASETLIKSITDFIKY